MKKLLFLLLVLTTAAFSQANLFSSAGNFEEVGEDGKCVRWDWQPNKVKEVGDKAWFSTYLNMQFEDKHGNVVKPLPPHPTIRESQSEWKPHEAELTLPAGAKLIAIKPVHWGASGTLSIDGIVVKLAGQE